MAWLNLPPSGVYQVGFRYAGRKFKRSLDTTNPQRAERARQRLEENLRLVDQGRLDVPLGVDVAQFLLYDGKLTFISHPVLTTSSFDRSPQVVPKAAQGYANADADASTEELRRHELVPNRNRNSSLTAMPLAEVLETFLKQLPVGALAEGTLRIARIHFDHLTEILGADTPMLAIDREHLQNYINERSKTNGRRGKLLSATTIKKELGTLSSVWTWAKGKYVAGDFPGKKLAYPATSDKSEFQTMAEVQRKIALGYLSPEEEEDLWDCVFLRACKTFCVKPAQLLVIG